MQACGLRFSLSQRLSASRQGPNRLPGDLTVAERPDRWLSCLRGDRIGRSSGEYRSNWLSIWVDAGNGYSFAMRQALVGMAFIRLLSGLGQVQAAVLPVVARNGV